MYKLDSIIQHVASTIMQSEQWELSEAINTYNTPHMTENHFATAVSRLSRECHQIEMGYCLLHQLFMGLSPNPVHLKLSSFAHCRRQSFEEYHFPVQRNYIDVY